MEHHMSIEDTDFIDNTISATVRATTKHLRRGEDLDEVRAERAQLKASEIALIRTRLGSSAAGHLTRAADRLVGSPTGKLSDSDYEVFNRSVGHAVRLSQLDSQLGDLEKRLSPRVVAEPRTYALDSPNSYFLDRATVVRDGMDFQDATGAASRLAQYDRELAHEVRERSPEGRRVERALGEECRSAVAELNRQLLDKRQTELRALVSGGGATASAGSGAAAFVSPYFAEEAFAPYRGIHRTFADQCDSMPLPSFGLQVYLPAFTSATSTTQQTEGSAVSETDPSTGFQSAQVVAVNGQITISQQLSDRAFTGGGSFDVALGKQLQQQLDEAIEKYVINQVLANAATVAGQGSFTIAGLYQDLASARGKLTDTAGTRLRPTHLFTTSGFYSYVTRQVDDQHRPIVTPRYVPGFPLAQGDEQTQWSRFTGIVLPGGVLWFEADAIPTVGTTSETQLIVSAPDEAVVLFEGAPVLSVFPQTDAASLELVANLRSYVAAVMRYPSGTASIAGAAYTAALV
jgi:hypothetical protein